MTSTTIFKVAVVTVSDTALVDASSDFSGPLIRRILQEQSNDYEVISSSIVGDEPSSIRQAITEAASAGAHLVLTTGGTGFAPRDVTPEAVQPLLKRDAPGLVHLMLQSSLQITPLAVLGRPVAGLTEQDMLVITLPGSPKGAKENLAAVLPVLKHALQLSTKATSSRSLHAEEPDLQHAAAGGCEHHVRPKTHDPTLGAAARHRASPYPVIEMDEAMALIFANSPSLPSAIMKVSPELRGHVLAEEVVGSHQLPATRTTNIDGYAVHSADGTGDFPVITSKQHSLPFELPRGSIYRVNTGGPIPDGADAVVMVEDTEVTETSTEEGRSEERTVKILAAAEQGENVRMPGSDVKQGELILEKGTIVTETGGELATLAFVGKSSVNVYGKPKVALLSTGNELEDISSASTASELRPIYDTNRPALTQALQSAGYSTVDLGIAKDREDATADALRKGAEQADVILATGGTSMGEFDFLKPVIERRLGGQIHFGRVSMKPGKPTTFATFVHAGQTKVVFSLPGNPASALVTNSLFVVPCLRRMGGYPQDRWELPRVKAGVQSDMKLDAGRPEFHRVVISVSQSAPYLVASSTGGQRSSKASSMAFANGFVCLPSGKSGATPPTKGDIVDAVLVANLQ